MQNGAGKKSLKGISSNSVSTLNITSIDRLKDSFTAHLNIFHANVFNLFDHITDEVELAYISVE